MKALSNLSEFKITDSIFNNLSKSADKENSKIVVAKCGDGSLNQFLANSGFKKVYGVDDDSEALTAARKRFKGKANQRFKSIDLSDSEAFKALAADVIICLDESILPAIPKGTRVVCITTKYESWPQACEGLAPYIAAGASTKQHGDKFLTFGMKS